MTTAEMCTAIVDYVRSRGNVSYVELVRHLGDEARGDLVIEFDHPRFKAVLWSEVSETFADAMDLAKPYIEPVPAHWLVYLADGGALSLPLAKQARRYQKPHWLPVVFNARKVPA